MATEVMENPVSDEVWRGLSPTSRSMIEYIVYSDADHLRNLVEGTVLFKIGNRQVHRVTPSPDIPAQVLRKKRR